jgi:hypothetical protein
MSVFIVAISGLVKIQQNFGAIVADRRLFSQKAIFFQPGRLSACWLKKVRRKILFNKASLLYRLTARWLSHSRQDNYRVNLLQSNPDKGFGAA